MVQDALALPRRYAFSIILPARLHQLPLKFLSTALYSKPFHGPEILQPMLMQLLILQELQVPLVLILLTLLLPELTEVLILVQPITVPLFRLQFMPTQGALLLQRHFLLQLFLRQDGRCPMAEARIPGIIHQLDPATPVLQLWISTRPRPELWTFYHCPQ